MSKASPAADRCPLCDGPIDPAIACLPRRLDAPIVRVLRADHPHWNPDDGACPECVFRAALQARSESRPYSLPEEASLPLSADSCDEARILQVPDRVQANPRLAGRGVTIAFLDSGFYPHPDLVRPTNRIVCHVDATTAEFRETARFKRPRGASWHGTMVACVGAGSGFQSDRRYRGIAHQARLALVKTGNPRSGPRLRIT